MSKKIDNRLSVLQLNSLDLGGGAEKIAQTLHVGLKEAGHLSRSMVGWKIDQDGDSIVIPNDSHRSLCARLFIGLANSLAPWGLGATREKLKWFGQQRRRKAIMRGEEDFDYPGTRHILDNVSPPPDILHCHNLHRGYFDIRYLEEVSNQMPVVLTLHDQWMMTGHCACFLGCERWKIGCGECPDLDIYPSIKMDATAYNWNRKKHILANCKFYIATPSKWLMDKVEQSILAPSVIGSRIIHNGVDLNVFKPGDKTAARAKMGIDKDANVLLFTAIGMLNSKTKDFKTLNEAITLISTRLPKFELQILALGEIAESIHIGKSTITFVPYCTDPDFVVTQYHAADIYVHSANSDNFPTTVLEALACGKPVVATSVGGIPEQIEQGVTGFLVSPKDSEGMADRIIELFEDDNKLKRMSSAAAESAKNRFDSNIMVREYLDYYTSILAREDRYEVGDAEGNKVD